MVIAAIGEAFSVELQCCAASLRAKIEGENEIAGLSTQEPHCTVYDETLYGIW